VPKATKAPKVPFFNEKSQLYQQKISKKAITCFKTKGFQHFFETESTPSPTVYTNSLKITIFTQISPIYDKKNTL
jgi:hypothetical protein